MAHDKLGPHEQRLRELRAERESRTKKPRKPIPYAGKPATGANEKLYGVSAMRGIKKGPRK